MKKQSLFVRISLVLTLLLLVAAVFVGCGEKDSVVETTVAVNEAEYTFEFTAVFSDGTKETHTVTTICETVGDALMELGYIEGEEGAYGIYVKTVCGVTADYDTDGTYWALYNDGEYSMVGVDVLKCADAKNVEFRVEK